MSRVNNFDHLYPFRINTSGGFDCGYNYTKPDLYVEGGAQINKSLCVSGNIMGNLVGTVFGSTTNGTLTKHWTVTTNNTIEYAAGFYIYASSDDTFSPSINFGPVNGAHAAHFFIVTGQIPTNDVTIRISGVSIQDTGVRNESDFQDIIILNGTSINSYFETSKKWLGSINIETISGTPITCNYGLSKYHDNANTDFKVIDSECLWVSDSNDSSSNIELIHHKDSGWSFNSGSSPSPPPPIISRLADYGPSYNYNYIGDGAWKHTNIDLTILGSLNEGIIWRITSGSTGLGSLSFRTLDIETKISVL